MTVMEQILLSMIFLMNYVSKYKNIFIKRLPVLLVITALVTFIFSFFLKSMEIYRIFSFFGLATLIDNLIIIYERKNN